MLLLEQCPDPDTLVQLLRDWGGWLFVLALFAIMAWSK